MRVQHAAQRRVVYTVLYSTVQHNTLRIYRYYADYRNWNNTTTPPVNINYTVPTSTFYSFVNYRDSNVVAYYIRVVYDTPARGGNFGRRYTVVLMDINAFAMGEGGY